MKRTLAVLTAVVAMVVSLLGAAAPAQAIDDYNAQWSAIQKVGPDTYRVCLSGLELFDASQTIEMYWDAEGEGGGRRVSDVTFDGDTACGTFTENFDFGGFVYATSPGTNISYTAVAYLSTVSVLDPACGPELTVEFDMKEPVPTGTGAVYLNGELFDTWSAEEGVTTVTYSMDGLNVPTAGSYTLEWVAAAPPYDGAVLGSAVVDVLCQTEPDDEYPPIEGVSASISQVSCGDSGPFVTVEFVNESTGTVDQVATQTLAEGHKTATTNHGLIQPGETKTVDVLLPFLGGSSVTVVAYLGDPAIQAGVLDRAADILVPLCSPDHFSVTVLEPKCGDTLQVQYNLLGDVLPSDGSVWIDGQLIDTWSAEAGTYEATYSFENRVPTTSDYTLEWRIRDVPVGTDTIAAECDGVGGPTPPPPPTPTPPPSPAPEPTSPTAKVKVKVPKQAKIKINVNPDLPGKKSWKVQVLKKKGTFVTVRTVRTKGPREVVTVDVPRGRYKVRVPAQRGYKAVTSQVVRVRR